MRRHQPYLMAVLTAVLLGAVPAAPGGTKVPASELEEAVRTFLVARRAACEEQGEIAFRSVPENIEVDANSYRLHVAGDNRTQWKGALAVRVEIEAGGRIVHRCLVSVLIRTYADVLVAERSIERHTRPAPGDLRSFRMETTLIQRRVLYETSALDGLRSRQLIPRGSILYEDLFELTPLVQQGDRVQVRVRSGGVTLSTEGTVRDDGDQGDLVTVELAGRRDRVRGRIDGERSVTIFVDAGKEK